MSITMSTSSAPFKTASSDSKALTFVVVEPSGKPITVQTATSLPVSFSPANFTCTGFTHTEAKPYCTASSQSFSI